jgi:predicted transcriptional regulator
MRPPQFWAATAVCRFASQGRLRRRILGSMTATQAKERGMAKKRKRKYSKGSSDEVRREMHRYKRGKAKSGKGGKGGKVKSRKQAIAIGLSKARRKGKKVPRKRKSK